MRAVEEEQEARAGADDEERPGVGITMSVPQRCVAQENCQDVARVLQYVVSLKIYDKLWVFMISGRFAGSPGS